MKSLLRMFVAASLVTGTLAQAQNGDIKVNGVTISQQRVEFFVNNLVSQGKPDSPELRNAVRQELITRELMSQEARRRGLDKHPNVAIQIDLARQDVLSRAFLQEVVGKSPASEEALRKEYERIKGQLGTREFKARHILVETEGEAKEILAQIRQGSSFEKLAAEKSKDQGTKVRGGELDWSVPANYVKPFGDALVRLKKGQMTEAPVQSNFGWHVIRLDDDRALKVPGYDEVKANLQQQLQRQATEKAIAELRAKAKIE